MILISLIQDVLTDVSVSMEKEVDGLLGVKPCFVHRVSTFVTFPPSNKLITPLVTI